jgi:hypothetical protein
VGRGGNCGGFAVGLLVSLVSSVASAWHGEDEHITDDTAWTQQGDKDFRLGLYKASVTIADRITLGTYILPWFARTPSAFAKLRFLSLGPTQWAVGAGVFRLDTESFYGRGPSVPVFIVSSANLVTSLELGPRHQLSNGLVVTVIRANGAIDDGTVRGQGEATLTNMHYVAAYEYRISRALALVVTGRYQLFQVLAGDTTFTARPDAYTSIEVAAAASDEHSVNYRFAFSVVPALAWSWQSFNLRFGCGYGNYNIPGINFMVARRTPIPELDLYWTF